MNRQEMLDLMGRKPKPSAVSKGWEGWREEAE